MCFLHTIKQSFFKSSVVKQIVLFRSCNPKSCIGTSCTDEEKQNTLAQNEYKVNRDIDPTNFPNY